jgi:hypothetical protein
VSAALNAHHINVKPAVRHLKNPLSVPCCMPSCTSRCTIAHKAASRRCLPTSYLSCCDLLQSKCDVAGGAGTIILRTSPYIGLWYMRGGGVSKAVRVYKRCWRSNCCEIIARLFSNKIVIHAGWAAPEFVIVHLCSASFKLPNSLSHFPLPLHVAISITIFLRSPYYLCTKLKYLADI